MEIDLTEEEEPRTITLGFVTSGESKELREVLQTPVSAVTAKQVEFDVNDPKYLSAQISASKDDNFHLTSFVPSGPHSELLRNIQFESVKSQTSKDYSSTYQRLQ